MGNNKTFVCSVQTDKQHELSGHFTQTRDVFPGQPAIGWHRTLVSLLPFFQTSETLLLTDASIHRDFNAPLTPPPRPADSSAATIAANGLLLLAQQETTAAARQMWTNSALQILSNITTLAWRPSWQSLLSNGTVNEPVGNLLTGIVYGA
jgi:hypothetical protein